MLIKTYFRWCYKLTLSTRILYSFMNSSSVSFKIFFCFWLMLTLTTRILHFLMNSSFEFCKISFWCCLILTLPTRILYYFMNKSLCWSRLPTVVASCWHCPQENFIPSWRALLCELMELCFLICSRILCKHILFLFVLNLPLTCTLIQPIYLCFLNNAAQLLQRWKPQSSQRRHCLPSSGSEVFSKPQCIRACSESRASVHCLCFGSQSTDWG